MRCEIGFVLLVLQVVFERCELRIRRGIIKLKNKYLTKV